MAKKMHHHSNTDIADTELLPELGTVAEVHTGSDESLQLSNGLLYTVLDCGY